MASLASFSQGLGSTDPGSVIPIRLHCWVSPELIGSSDPVSEEPISVVSAQLSIYTSFFLLTYG
jgi:hypothetical protein